MISPQTEDCQSGGIPTRRVAGRSRVSRRSLPARLAQIGNEFRLHIVRLGVRSKNDNALPLIVTHSWPGTVIGIKALSKIWWLLLPLVVAPQSKVMIKEEILN